MSYLAYVQLFRSCPAGAGGGLSFFRDHPFPEKSRLDVFVVEPGTAYIPVLVAGFAHLRIKIPFVLSVGILSEHIRDGHQQGGIAVKKYNISDYHLCLLLQAFRNERLLTIGPSGRVPFGTGRPKLQPCRPEFRRE